MALVNDDIATARRAVAGLERAARALVAHFGDSLDARRLLADVERIGPDLDLLCGAPAATPAPAPAAPTPREVIPDTSYTHEFWMDAEDEGVGRWSTPGR